MVSGCTTRDVGERVGEEVTGRRGVAWRNDVGMVRKVEEIARADLPDGRRPW
jgi:hypothetical protein